MCSSGTVLGLDIKRFNKRLNKKEIKIKRKKLGYNYDDIIMIFPAEINKNKNQEMLIKVMNKIVNEKKMTNYQLILAGVDGTNGYCEKNIKKFN